MMGRRPSTLECLCLRGYTGNRCLSCAQKGDPLLISFVLSERDLVTFCIDWTALSHRSPHPCSRLRTAAGSGTNQRHTWEGQLRHAIHAEEVPLFHTCCQVFLAAGAFFSCLSCSSRCVGALATPVHPTAQRGHVQGGKWDVRRRNQVLLNRGWMAEVRRRTARGNCCFSNTPGKPRTRSGVLCGRRVCGCKTSAEGHEGRRRNCSRSQAAFQEARGAERLPSPWREVGGLAAAPGRGRHAGVGVWAV